MRTSRSITRSPSTRLQRGMSLIETIIVITPIGAVLTPPFDLTNSIGGVFAH